MSLPEQEADARRICADRGWQIVDVMIVPGHSRSIILEYDKLVTAAMRKGIPAFAQLRQHWEQRDFDVLIVRDGDRLARAQGLLGTIVESVIQSGAVIWSMNDGEINLHNYRFWIAMTGLRSSAHVDQLVIMRDKGLTRRIQNGRPLTAQVPISHRVIRDDKGQPQALELNEAVQPMIYTAAELLVAGVPWREIEFQLLKQHGYSRADGSQHREGKFYRLFHNPVFWGHTARKTYQGRKPKGVHNKNGWTFDPLVEPPQGVMVIRNTHPPALSGELAKIVISELRKRQSLRGHATSNQYRFTGLVICGSCKRNIIYSGKTMTSGNRTTALICQQARQINHERFLCDNKGQILEARVFEFVNDTLQKMLAGVDLVSMANNRQPSEPSIDYSAAAENLERRARALIAKQSEMPGEIASLYDDELNQIATALKTARHRAFEQRQEREIGEVGFAQTRDEIARIGLERFWQLPPGEINRTLRALFGRHRLVMLNKKIVGIVKRDP